MLKDEVNGNVPSTYNDLKKAFRMQCLQSYKQNFNMFVTCQAACRAEENNFQRFFKYGKKNLILTATHWTKTVQHLC
jgi:hypothetical protein